jgi:glycosyltransferase involved in cell wall biosynthesis
VILLTEILGKGDYLSKIKVLHISQAAGGVQRHVLDITSGIDKARFDVTGVCPPHDLVKGVSLNKESFIEGFKRLGISAHPVNMRREIRPISDLLAFIEIYSFIKRERFDVVHTHSSKAGFLGRIAARLAGVPAVVHTPNSFAFDRPGHMVWQRIFYAFLEKVAGFFCDKVMAVCLDEKELAVRRGVLPPEKIVLISNIIVNTSDLKCDIDTQRKRKELGIGESERIVVSVGRLAPQKSPANFVLAAKKVLQKGKDVKFLMLGDGPLFKGIENLVKKNGISKEVRLLGWRDDSLEVIAASDIFALSSLWEVLPNHSLLDAMALGKPAVITATCGARDW